MNHKQYIGGAFNQHTLLTHLYTEPHVYRRKKGKTNKSIITYATKTNGPILFFPTATPHCPLLNSSTDTHTHIHTGHIIERKLTIIFSFFCCCLNH